MPLADPMGCSTLVEKHCSNNNEDKGHLLITCTKHIFWLSGETA